MVDQEDHDGVHPGEVLGVAGPAFAFQPAADHVAACTAIRAEAVRAVPVDQGPGPAGEGQLLRVEVMAAHAQIQERVGRQERVLRQGHGEYRIAVALEPQEYKTGIVQLGRVELFGPDPQQLPVLRGDLAAVK